jgi:arylsulfatase B
MSLHIDLLPTFIDICALERPQNIVFDGMSLAPLLSGQRSELPDDRFEFIQYRQETVPPDKWVNAVMTRRWRLVRGQELFDIKADPGQKNNVAAQHPDVVARLREAHEKWWEEIRPRLDEYCPIVLGNDAENPTCLNAMDVMGDVAWSQSHIVMAQKSTGRWTVEVERPGTYRFSLRRWPLELRLPIDEALSSGEAQGIAPYFPIKVRGAIHPTKARLRIFDREEVVAVKKGADAVVLDLPLQKTGPTQLEAWFVDEGGDSQGAYYVYVQRL